ncbi:hypothetical protein D3C72_1362250 [compost metagenome]
MHRQHRQERNERTGDQHREHVAEVGAGGHLDVLEHVGEGAPPFEYALLQHHQALFQEDDVGGFLGDVHRTVHGYTDVGGAQGWSVVDAVTHETDHMAVAFEDAHDALLVRRRQFGEDVGGLYGNRQFGIAHAFNVVTQ